MALIAFRVLRCDNDIIKVSLIDENGEKRDIPVGQLISAMSAPEGKRVHIDNLGLDKNKRIKGTCGILDRYPSVSTQRSPDGSYANLGVINKDAWTIIGEYPNGNLMVVRFDGETAVLKKEKLIGFCKSNQCRLTNASVVENEFIRSISGNIRKLEETEKQKEIRKKFEAAKKEVEDNVSKNIEAYNKEADNKRAIGNMVEKQTKVGDNEKITLGKVELDKTTVDLMKSIKHHRQCSNVVDMSKLQVGSSKLEDIDEETGLTLEDKFIAATTVLKYIDTFIYAAYLTLELIYLDKPSDGIVSFAVTNNELIVVIPALKERTLSQISWGILHEIYHVLMRHVSRRRNRDPYLWNVACDLYVNKTIDDNYNCKPGTPVQKVLYKNVTPIGIEFPLKIDSGKGIMWQSLYRADVDAQDKTEEDIYDEIYNENRDKIENRNSGDKSDKSDNSDQDKSDNSDNLNQDKGSDGKQGNKEEKQESDDNEQGSKGDKQESGDGEQESGDGEQESKEDGASKSGSEGKDGDSKDGQDEQSSSGKSSGKFNGQGGSGNGQGGSGNEPDGSGNEQGDSQNGEDKSKSKQNSKPNLTYKGEELAPNRVGETEDERKARQDKLQKKLEDAEESNSEGSGSQSGNKSNESGDKGESSSDNGDDEESETTQIEITEDILESEKDADKTQQELEAEAKQNVVKIMQKAKDLGMDKSNALRMIQASIVDDPSYRSFIQRFMTMASIKDSSFKTPNKKMMNHGYILPGIGRGELDSAEAVYIGIDVSGSVSDTELSESLGYIISMLRIYKLTGYIVFWDTDIRGVIKFNTVQEVMRAKEKLVDGGGGTNVNKFIDYLNSPYCRVKPQLTIIITDGQVGKVTSRPKRMFGETIWVITDYNMYKRFKPGFGFVAPLHAKNS